MPTELIDIDHSKQAIFDKKNTSEITPIQSCLFEASMSLMTMTDGPKGGVNAPPVQSISKEED